MRRGTEGNAYGAISCIEEGHCKVLINIENMDI